jgi:Domain of unknown function (DUF4157)
MKQASVQERPSSSAFLSPVRTAPMLQSKCACGGMPGPTGECEACRKKRIDHQRKVASQSGAEFSQRSNLFMQRKLTIGSSHDPLEQEADRIADQVMATQSRSRVSDTPLHIQRFTGQASGQMDTAPASVDRVLASSGRPLEPALQQDMQQRFGHDFSRVRVHSGSTAEQSARDVNAKAYTVGHDIVFGAGRFAPTTHEGRHLIAHELIHTVQQNQTSTNLIQKKELGGGLGSRLFSSRRPQDWYFPDRMEWQRASVGGTLGALSGANTFIRAAIYNTQNLLPGEYSNVEQRHNYYDLISYVIEHDPNTPAAARGVRFFHATTLVTGSPGIGAVDSVAGAITLQQESRVILREVNAELFALNMGVIRNLLLNWREPRSPTNPSAGAISAFEFDLQMVETEQTRVEDYINRNRSRFTADVTIDINETLDPDSFGQSLNPTQLPVRWAMGGLGESRLDFTNRMHRVAIGIASVHIFHRRTIEDYSHYIGFHLLSSHPSTE